jgi:hypothetical protein
MDILPSMYERKYDFSIYTDLEPRVWIRTIMCKRASYNKPSVKSDPFRFSRQLFSLQVFFTYIRPEKYLKSKRVTFPKPVSHRLTCQSLDGVCTLGGSNYSWQYKKYTYRISNRDKHAGPSPERCRWTKVDDWSEVWKSTSEPQRGLGFH